MRAGFAKVDMTPLDPIPLAGYSARDGNFERVDAPLEANLAVFMDGDGDGVVLGSLDTLFVGDAIRDAIAEESGLSRSRLVLVSTHTHNAPSLAPDVPLLGRHDAGYGDMVVRRVGEAIRSLVNDPAASTVSATYAERHTPLNINRRRPAWVLDYSALRRGMALRFGKTIALAPFRDGVIDATLRCILLRDEAGTIKAIIWSFPCHPAFYPFTTHVSSDFPGLVRDHLRGVFGAGCAVIYLPGLAGSAIPDIPFQVPRSAGDLVRRMLPFNPILTGFTPSTYREWGDKLARAAAACVEDARRASPEPEPAARHRSLRTPAVFHRSAPNDSTDIPDIRLDMVRLDFGDRCGITAITGEVIGEWSSILAPHLPERRIATGYLAGPCLYVPTDTAVREKGYEADGFREAFGLDGNFATGLDGTISRAMASLYSEGSPATC